MADPDPADPVARWFARRRFGLFLHFGIYAVNGWHEQDQMRRRIPRAEYEKLADAFDPHAWDPEAILDLAEAAGMDYVCLTTKHHDGFCLWDTAETDFNSMQACGRDLVGELAAACHRRDFALGLYYSIADWHHPAYPNQGRHHELPGPEPGDGPDWNAYIRYLRAQVEELATRYGRIRHWFWDINVPEHRDPSINARLRELQPGTVINDRGFDAGDFSTPEREYQADETGRVWRFDQPTEACNSLGTQSWGYRRDEGYYSSSFLIRSIDEIHAKGGHFLLNTGPMPDGSIAPRDRALLGKIGSWYQAVREAFGDAEPASHLTSNREVLLTRRGDRTLYVHVPAPLKSDLVVLPPIDQRPASATLLNTGASLEARVEVLPPHWQTDGRYLNLRGWDTEALAAGTLVIRLDFPESIREAGDAPTQEFQG